DSTSYGNDGANTGTVFNSGCWIDGGREYNDDDYITVNNFTYTPDALTAEAWVYRDSTTFINIFCDGTHFNTCDWILYLRTASSTQGIDFGVNNHATYYRTGNTPANTWFYLAATYNSGNINLYVNGSLVGSGTIDSSINNNYNDLGLGNDNDGGQGWANGKLDELRVSKVSRSSGWIQTSFNTMSDPDSFFDIGSEETGVPPEAPEVYYEHPADGATDVNISLSELSFSLRDSQGDAMDYNVETSPDIGSGIGTGVSNGTYNISVSSLTYYTTYTWYVNVTDGTHWTNETFVFTTEKLDKQPPEITILYPNFNTIRNATKQVEDYVYTKIAVNKPIEVAYVNLHQGAGNESMVISTGINGTIDVWSGTPNDGTYTSANAGVIVEPKTSGLKITGVQHRLTSTQSFTVQIYDEDCGCSVYEEYFTNVSDWGWTNFTGPLPSLDASTTYRVIRVNSTNYHFRRNILPQEDDYIKVTQGYYNGNTNLNTQGISKISYQTSAYTAELNLTNRDGVIPDITFYCKDTSDNWNSTSYGRTFEVNCTPENINYTHYYLWKWDYSSECTNSGPTYCCSPWWCMRHEQSVDGTLTDTGIFNASQPSSGDNRRYCSCFTLYRFDESVALNPTIIDNIYYHWWWNSNTGAGVIDCDHVRAKNWHSNTGDAVTVYTSDAVANISHVGHSHSRFYLNAGLMDVSDYLVDDNDVYNLAVYFRSDPDCNSPEVISMSNASSFVVLNVPDNATLQGLDSDGDGLSDYEELYVTFTDPWDVDTDDGGVNDYMEYLAGSNPLRTEDDPTGVIIGNEIPANGSIEVPLNPTLYVTINHPNNATMNLTFRTNASSGSWVDIGTNSSVHNGTYSQATNNMDSYDTVYWWSVNCTDGTFWTNETYWFRTLSDKPVVFDPSPADDAVNVPISLSELSFNFRDNQGDTMDYTVETSPNIGSGSDTDVSNGTYSIPITGLDFNTTYTWYVNVTDPTGSGRWTNETFTFTTCPFEGEPPSTTLNFAGNPNDKGGPHYLPGTNVEAPEGYYTTASHQQENWIYINCTVTDNAGVDQVWLHWLNGTRWINDTYQLIH
ncbi:MAG: hypothetical protein DRN01_06510, partial [Thermoplasmata archaeon]